MRITMVDSVAGKRLGHLAQRRKERKVLLRTASITEPVNEVYPLEKSANGGEKVA